MKPLALYLAEIIEAIASVNVSEHSSDLDAAFALGIQVGAIAERCQQETGNDASDTIDAAVAMVACDDACLLN